MNTMMPLSESRVPRTMALADLPALALSQRFNQQDVLVAGAVAKVLAQAAVDVASDGGQMIDLAAGGSGRPGVLDAAECPPAPGVGAEHISGLIADGGQAMFQTMFQAMFQAKFQAMFQTIFQAMFQAKFQAMFQTMFQTIFQAAEVAEDEQTAPERYVQAAGLQQQDVVLGLAASGCAPCLAVHGGLLRAALRDIRRLNHQDQHCD